MTHITALIRTWLAADSVVSSLCGDRIAALVEPSMDRPAIVIGALSGGPRSTPSRTVDVVEDWNVALYVLAGRKDGGKSDLPNTILAMDVMRAVAGCAAQIIDHPFVDASGSRIAAVSVVSASPAIDPDTNEGRATITLQVTAIS
jgi:hypothetical protein